MPLSDTFLKVLLPLLPLFHLGQKALIFNGFELLQSGTMGGTTATTFNIVKWMPHALGAPDPPEVEQESQKVEQESQKVEQESRTVEQESRKVEQAL